MIKEKMQEAVEIGVFPGAVLLISLQGKIIFHEAFGQSAVLPERKNISRLTIFDIASLTKPLATTTAIMILVRDKQLALSDTLNRFFPEMENSENKEITLFQLLNHSSGLPAWRPFYERWTAPTPESREEMYCLVREEKQIYPAGSRSLYCDLGFIILGEIIEKVSGVGMDKFSEREIFKKLNLFDTAFINLLSPDPRPFSGRDIAATEDSAYRKKIICGEVHDDNAYILGGVSGHAGLFSTAEDISLYVDILLKCANDSHDFLPSELIKKFIVRQNTPNSTWGLGWDTPSEKNSSAGQYFSRKSFGHLGYTGTSLWTDPEKELTVILLSNRVHPTSRNNLIKDFRPKIHDLIYKEFL